MKVTVLTVAYNSEKTISRTIESVLKQTYSSIEYIIIDGASSDRTVSIAKKYMNDFKEKGYQYIVISEPDRGMYDALNKGIKRSTGELIASINSDDYYEPDAVDVMVKFYEEVQYDIAWADLNVVSKSSVYVKHAKIGKLWVTSRFCHPTMFVKKEVFLELPYVCIDMDDDFDFILKANKVGKKICVKKGKALANYAIGGMSTERNLGKALDRVRMKYTTYVRNGYSRWYLFYCIAIEVLKLLMG